MKLIAILVVLAIPLSLFAGTIYQYRDNSGQPVFVDRELSVRELQERGLTLFDSQVISQRPAPPPPPPSPLIDILRARYSAASREAKEEPKGFGSVTIESYSFLPVSNRVGLKIRYRNDTEYTFTSSVTIRCKSFKGSEQTGGDSCYIFADDWGPITPGKTIPKECSIYPETRGTERAICEAAEGQ